eukprot:TRINITY_DN17126_c0_g1_i1.p1 TRINITY_DN17126_c0_g1~~TRINITY_DN17126_c0_g1_i1.p1  ORF type:complete len:461 (+),score=109.40 TRINITY_DN17126_c0_g1_i1:109-1491(+)
MSVSQRSAMRLFLALAAVSVESGVAATSRLTPQSPADRQSEHSVARRCPYLHAEFCSTPRARRFFEVWPQKVHCWLCENVTAALAEQSVGIIKEMVDLDLPLTEEGGLTPPWLETCLPLYVLAMLMTTRAVTLQTWRMYEFGLNILWDCQYDELAFFHTFGVTPRQLEYVFSLVGQRFALSDQILNLQAQERLGRGATAVAPRRMYDIWSAPLVIDVGMGLGADARYYLRQGFRVVAVEANPEAIEAAISDDNMSHYLRSGQLSVVNAGVSAPDSNETEVSFFVLPKRPEQSKVLEWITQDGALEVTVRTVRCADLLRVYGKAIYMKVDVEFNTVDCLESLHQEALAQRALKNDWRPPRYLSLEIESSHLVDIFYERLVDLGYVSYKACRQFLFSPGPCEQGAYESEVLGCGSGPFGEASVDYRAGPQWRNLDELREDSGFLTEFVNGRDWFDLHFKLAD